MKIAEKYRKELREFNEGTRHLPAHAQNGSKEEKPIPEPETLQLKKTWKDEVDVVREANDMDNELEKGVERSPSFTETSSGKSFLFP